MIRIGVAPRLLDFQREVFATIDSWFNQVGVRMNVINKAGAPVVADVPTNQWAIYKNTSTGAVVLAVNDEGTLKTVAIT